ncbi:hypothetical protein F5Y09DRAFT_353746 [Xylaria sp. FL1042]|nr:hypothetical protein F5Y09DRAFT_353746 [Xylaria sp. FL1042]
MADSLLSTRPVDTSNYHVRLGLWTNWSQGSILGPTLTLHPMPGGLLTAFTAVFITMVATRFWRISCLLLHWHFSTHDKCDMVHHQRQAIFRNTESSVSGLILLVKITHAWGRQKSLRRILPFIIYAVLCFAGFSIASIFSSAISSLSRKEILIDGSHCGTVDITGLSTQEYAQVYGPWKSAIVNNAASYAQQVYSPNSTGTVRAPLFVKNKLRTIINTDATCPFEGLCRSNTSNLFLDTGYLNIIDDLGVNLPRDQSILYRRAARCGPLITENRSEPTDLYGLSNYTGYKYGPSFLDGDGSNYTVIVRDVYSQNIRQSAAGWGFSGYGLLVASALMSNGTPSAGTFRPNPDMYRADSDTYLFFLSGNGVLATQPTDDPWYRFKVRSNETDNGLRGVNMDGYYMSAEAASPLGCTMQTQFCKGPDANDASCGPLSSYDDAVRGALSLFNIDIEAGRDWIDGLTDMYSTDTDASRFLWLLSIFQHYSPGLDAAVSTLGSYSLASQRTLQSGLQGPISDEEWKLDVGNWWNISLSMLQASFVDTSNGPTNQNIARFYRNATNRGQQSVCQNQKILSTSYISVNVFGLAFTYIVGSLIILVFFTLEPMLSRGEKGLEKADQWKGNEVLHLQGLAYGARDEWESCPNPVPIPNNKDQTFGPLKWADSRQSEHRHPGTNLSDQPETPSFSSSARSPGVAYNGLEDHTHGEEGPVRMLVRESEAEPFLEQRRRPSMTSYPQTSSHYQHTLISNNTPLDDNLRFPSRNTAFVPPLQPPELSPRVRGQRS